MVVFMKKIRKGCAKLMYICNFSPMKINSTKKVKIVYSSFLSCAIAVILFLISNSIIAQRLDNSTERNINADKSGSQYFAELKDSAMFIGAVRLEVKGINQTADLQINSWKAETFDGTLMSEELKNYLLNRKEQHWSGIASYKQYAYTTYSTIARNNFGKIEKVSPLNYELTNIRAIETKKSNIRAFATTSVLRPGSGKWYKIGIKNTGVYKIDYDFLQSMGINPDTLIPSRINIYGNSTGMLNENYTEDSPDDLKKCAIYIEGESDGVFNTGDYILFYGKSAFNWSYNSSYKRFLHTNNYFSDSSFFYLNISASNSPKRIQVNTTTSIPNFTSGSFDDYIFHELDAKNFIKSGRKWMGEEFDIVDSRDFGFSFNNISIGEKIKMYISLAGYTAGPSNVSSFGLAIPAGGISKTIYIPGIYTGAYQDAAKMMTDTLSFLTSTSNMNLKLTFSKFALDSKGWLDFFSVNVRRNYVLNGEPIYFRDIKTVLPGRVSQFDITSPNTSTMIWNVTSPDNAFDVGALQTGFTWSFVQNTDSLLEFAAFVPSQLGKPSFVKEIQQQDLHSLPQVDFLVITHPLFYSQALELASLHSASGLSSHVVTTEQIYNEFSSGAVDAAAIRNFIKMFYDRASGNSLLTPKHVLLFGDGSYDNKSVLGMGQNFIPTHQSSESIQILVSYTSDDYFGLLDDNELVSTTSALLDVGVGRLPVKSSTEATNMVNKIRNYMNNTYVDDNLNICGASSKGSMGTWRNRIVLIADDEDGAAYVRDCENFYKKIKSKANDMEVTKVYLDAFTQTITPGGQRVYEAESLFKESVQNGSIIVNYVGHGGEIGLAAERILDVPTVNAWTNAPLLPIFVTATCEFSRFDDPFRSSAGEFTLLNSLGGAIAMLTTTRLVFSSANSALNNAFYDNVFDVVNGEPKRFGEVIMDTKNMVPQLNSRNFTLLGDPALRIKFPYNNVVLDSINGVSISTFNDTLKALSTITMSGHVEDYTGSKLTSFNGISFPKVYDKVKQLSTLGQDPTSSIVKFEAWKNLLYQGRVSVTNGNFRFSFVIPKDLNQNVDTGRFVGYANDNSIDGNGYSQKFVAGGINLNAPTDVKGPEIIVYMNESKFVNGGTTNANPFLVIELKDENGINTVGTGIGHDITLVVDGKTAQTINLNEKYQADKDSYKSGRIRYQLTELSDGDHTAKIKAFDVYNNSAEQEVKFTVKSEAEMVLKHVLNWPNPFTTNTEFMFEHNQSCNYVSVQLQIFTISGKLVKTISQDLNTEGFRVNGIKWDGKDDFGDKLARGTYIYRLKAKVNNLTAEKMERLVILY